jgi:hypothetical protein
VIVLAWVLLGISVVGFAVTFPLWLMDAISERAMLGITLALSWAALLYSAALFIFEARRSQREKDG